MLLAVALVAAALAAGSDHRRADRRAKAVRVEISEFSFHPHTLHVAPGTRVVFANGDPTAHTATREGSFETGHIQPGHSVTVRLGSARCAPGCSQSCATW